MDYVYTYKHYLQTLKYWKNFASHVSTCEHVDCTDNDLTPANNISSNIDDESIDDKSNGSMIYFNTLTGLWEFGGKSTHKPKEMKDIQLSRFVKSQINCIMCKPLDILH